MRNIALRLSYDGSAYHGWQVQKTESSVAETLERALGSVCGGRVHVTGCGRTDAGVHAERYCANFRTESTIPTSRLPLAVNSRLPGDIAVQAAVEADDGFGDFAVHVFHGAGHALALVAALVAVTHFEGFAAAGGGAGRHGGAADVTGFETDFHFNSGIAAGVENLAGPYGSDGAVVH